MSYRIDYHMHTRYSDGKDTYKDHIEVAISKGLSEIGFTDHITLKPVDWAVEKQDFEKLRSELTAICNNGHEPMQIKFGIEVDYLEGKEDEIKKTIDLFPVDYVIGSVHFIGDWNFDTDRSQYEKRPNDEVYRLYFDLLKKAAQSGLFDIIAHFDLVKKLNCWPESDQTDLYYETLKIIKEADIAIEINTSGIDRPCGEFFPHPRILKMACDIGIPVTMGSDAHKKEQVGRHFDKAISVLKEAGYKKIARFSNRERSFIEI